MFLEQKATDVTTEDVLKGIEQLGNLDFSKIKMSSLIEKLVEWAATTGFKLISYLFIYLNISSCSLSLLDAKKLIVFLSFIDL